MSKILYIDVETTGLVKYTAAIIQLAYIIEIDGVVKKRGSFKINPETYNKPVTISDKALEVNGITPEEFRKFQHSKEACEEFIEILKRYVDVSNKEDKFKLVAYNANFDAGFVQEWFKDNKRSAYGLLIDYRHLDPFEIFKFYVYTGVIEHKYNSFDLEHACKTIGLEFDGHDAVADIEATRDLFQYLIRLTKGE
jgi:DNA polymerase III epsilon subunit-like protein